MKGVAEPHPIGERCGGSGIVVYLVHVKCDYTLQCYMHNNVLAYPGCLPNGGCCGSQSCLGLAEQQRLRSALNVVAAQAERQAVEI